MQLSFVKTMLARSRLEMFSLHDCQKDLKGLAYSNRIVYENGLWCIAMQNIL